MSTTITISDKVAQHLDRIEIEKASNLDDKLRSLLGAEYARRLARFRLTDRQLRQKYSMDFEAFEKQQMTKQLGYKWEVESDAIVWETALDGIHTIEQQLAMLKGEGQGDDDK